jgi:hypothetical protein
VELSQSDLDHAMHVQNVEPPVDAVNHILVIEIYLLSKDVASNNLSVEIFN